MEVEKPLHIYIGYCVGFYSNVDIIKWADAMKSLFRIFNIFLIIIILSGCVATQETEDTDPIILLNQGVAFIEGDQNDETIAYFNKAIELNPRYAEAYYNRGLAYFNKGQDDKAITDYSKAIELNSRYAEAYYSRGVSYANYGMYDKAISDYRITIVINPQHVLAHYNLAKAYAEKGWFSKALKTANETLRICIDPKTKKELGDLIAVYENKVDDKYKDFSAADKYRMVVAYEVHSNWEFPSELIGIPSDLKARLIFKVMPNGEIKDLFFDKRSGNNDFDDSVYKAIMKSNPVDPHPKSISEPYVTMGLRFTPAGIQ